MRQATMELRIPMNVLRGGHIIRQDARVPIDRTTYEIAGDTTVYDFSRDNTFKPRGGDIWALEEIVSRMRDNHIGTDAAISSLVGEIIREEGDKVMMWPLSFGWGIESISYKEKQVPDWLALDVFNAYMHGDPNMWDPYGIEQPSDSIALSARDFIRTYSDSGLEWFDRNRTLDTLVMPNEQVRGGSLKKVSYNLEWLWGEGHKPKSVHGLQALADFGIALPLKSNYPMFHSLIALATHVFFRGRLVTRARIPTITAPPWINLPEEGQSLSDVDYRLRPFTAYNYQNRVLTLNNPASAEIGRVLTTMGVPAESEQRYGTDMYVLSPVAQAHKLLEEGAKDNLLRKFVRDYVETFLLLRGDVRYQSKNSQAFNLSFFGQKIPLPKGFDPSNGIDDIIAAEPPNGGFEEHMDLIQSLFPGLKYSLANTRRIRADVKEPYYLKSTELYFLDVDRLMDTMPKLKVHYDRPNWK